MSDKIRHFSLICKLSWLLLCPFVVLIHMHLEICSAFVSIVCKFLFMYDDCSRDLLYLRSCAS